MNEKVILNAGLIIAVIAIFGFLAFRQAPKQGLDLKGGVYIVLKANPIPDENKKWKRLLMKICLNWKR